MNTPEKPTQKSALRRVVAASIIGSTLEWYDFFLYATASALVLGPVFFPNSDPAVGPCCRSRRSGSDSPPAPSVRSSSATSATVTADAPHWWRHWC